MNIQRGSENLEDETKNPKVDTKRENAPYLTPLDVKEIRSEGEFGVR